MRIAGGDEVKARAFDFLLCCHCLLCLTWGWWWIYGFVILVKHNIAQLSPEYFRGESFEPHNHGAETTQT